MQRSGFALTKWYLDCVDREGRTAIVYWTSLAWRGLAITWHGVACYRDDHPPCLRTSVHQVAPPRQVANGLEWSAASIGTVATFSAVSTPIDRVLLEPSHSGISWRCEAAAADVAITCGDDFALAGRGYAEHLTLTLAPWDLPITELRWGRWIADASPDSLVWIDWRGSRPQSLVWRNGQLAAQAAITDAGIRTDGIDARFDSTRTLYARSLGDTLGRFRGVVAPVVPAAWLAMEDSKARSVMTLPGSGGRLERGWAIHEKVVLP